MQNLRKFLYNTHFSVICCKRFLNRNRHLFFSRKKNSIIFLTCKNCFRITRSSTEGIRHFVTTNNESRIANSSRSNLRLATGMMLPMLSILFIISMRIHLRIRYGVLMLQQGMLRWRQMIQMMNLTRYGISGIGIVTMHDGHRITFIWRLFAARQSTTNARHFRPPDPRGGQDAGAEGYHQSQDEELQNRSSGYPRSRGWFRCS